MSAAPKIFLTASAVATLAFVAPVVAPAGALEPQSKLRLAPHTISLPSSVGRASIPTIDEAEQLVVDGRLREARGAFGSIIDNARVRGDYMPRALEGFANVKYMLEDVRGAARAYEDLGGAAETYGDPVTELNARFKAALLFQETHDKRAVALQTVRIKQLLKSPAIAQETRDAIAKRIQG